MGKMKIEGEDLEDLGLTLIVDESDESDESEESDESAAFAAAEVSLVIDIRDEVTEISILPSILKDVSYEDSSREDDVEKDLLSQLEAILSPGDVRPPEDTDEVAVPRRKKVKASSDDDYDDDNLGDVRPRQKNEVHCSRCYILVKNTIIKCPVDDDNCPVLACIKK